jgi:anaerobic magnesium-protoporphyrin IX monomethyl ester cyclase
MNKMSMKFASMVKVGIDAVRKLAAEPNVSALPRIVLVSIPVWTIETPPLSISYLKSFMASKGYFVKCVDANIALIHLAKPEFRKYWNQTYYSHWQEEEKYASTIFPQIVAPNISAVVESIMSSEPDIVGISVYSNCFARTLAEEIKKRDKNILIVAGGQVCVDSLQGKELKKSKCIDIIVRGEGEYSLKSIAEQFSSKKDYVCIPGCWVFDGSVFLDTGADSRIIEPDSLPLPDFDDFDVGKYRQDFNLLNESRNLPILISRGCANRCDFCLQRIIWHTERRDRTADSVFSEMVRDKERYGITSFVFADLLINGNLEVLEGLCDCILRSTHSFNWWGGAIVNGRMAPELFKKLRKAGCHQMTLGVESASDNVLRAMRKPYTSSDARRFVKDMRDAGLNIGMNLIIGHPSESRDDFLDTVRFVLDVRKYMPTQPWLSICTIFRDSDIYKKYIADPDFKYDALAWSYKSNTLEERRFREEIFVMFCEAIYGKFEKFNSE